MKRVVAAFPCLGVLLAACGDDGGHRRDDDGGTDAMVVACSATLATAQCARLGPDFDVTSAGANPSGPWSYGDSPTLGAAFHLFTQHFDGTNISLEGLQMWADPDLFDGSNVHLPTIGINATTTAVSPNGTYTVQPRQVLAHPGQGGQYAIARYTVPTAGPYTVQATFVGLSGTNGNPITTTDTHIAVNGGDILTGMLDPAGAGSTYCGAAVVALEAGATVDFSIGYGNGSYLNDSTGVDAVICPAP